jgi:hypothetical protein
VRARDPDERRRREAEGETRAPEPVPPDSLLGLQRSAGNRAVSAMLSRQPGGTAGAEAEPMKEEKGATATLGLGEDQVIPIESYAWDFKASEVGVSFLVNPAASEIAEAAASGRPFATGFVSTYKMMSRMTDIVLTSYQMSEGGGGAPMITIRVNFKDVTHEPVK